LKCLPERVSMSHLTHPLEVNCALDKTGKKREKNAHERGGRGRSEEREQAVLL